MDPSVVGFDALMNPKEWRLVVDEVVIDEDVVDEDVVDEDVVEVDVVDEVVVDEDVVDDFPNFQDVLEVDDNEHEGDPDPNDIGVPGARRAPSVYLANRWNSA